MSNKRVTSKVSQIVYNKYDRDSFLYLIHLFLPEAEISIKELVSQKITKIGHFIDYKTKEKVSFYEIQVKQVKDIYHFIENHPYFKEQVKDNQSLFIAYFMNDNQNWFLCYIDNNPPHRLSNGNKTMKYYIKMDRSQKMDYVIRRIISLTRIKKIIGIKKIQKLFDKSSLYRSFMINFRKIYKSILLNTNNNSYSTDNLKKNNAYIAIDIVLNCFLNNSELINKNYFKKPSIIKKYININKLQSVYKNKMIIEKVNILSSYNYTIEEDIGDNIKIAIDPQILEKILQYIHSKDKKKAGGIYYTPKPIINSMCNQTIKLYLKDIPKNEHKDKLSSLKVCDPACGCGSFLIGIFEQLCKYIDSDKDIKQSKILNSIYGIDIDDKAIMITKIRLIMKYLSITKPIDLNNLNRFIDSTNHKVICKDSLSDNINFKYMKMYNFDIMISNPPYLGQKGNKDIFQKIKNLPKWKHFYKRKQDLYYYFLVLGIDMLKDEYGILSYIIPSYFLGARNGDRLRDYIQRHTSILQIYSWKPNQKLFTHLGIDNIIIYLKKSKKYNSKKINIIESDLRPNNKTKSNIKSYMSKYSTMELSYKEWDIFNYGNDVDIDITECVSLGRISRISPGIQTGCDFINKHHIKKNNLNSNMIGNGIFVLSDKEKIDLNLCNLEKDYLKPFYKNSDINKWFSEDRNTRWLLYTNGIDDINDFPNIKSHLLRNKQILDNRYRNYALQKADRERRWWVLYGYRPNTDFESEKIICPYRSFSNIFAYSDKPFYASIDVFYLFIEDPHYDLYYILGILNSKLILYWLKKKGKMKGKIIELVKKPLSKIPIKIQSGKEQETISSIVNQIIQIKKDNEDDKIPPLECNLNDIIFDLYKVDSKDRKYIENNINKGE